MTIFKAFVDGAKDSLNRIAALVEKELTATLRDKGARIVLIVPVLLQSVIFGYGATFNLDRVPWVLLNESPGSLASEFVRRIDSAPGFDLQRRAMSEAEFTRSIDASEALLGIRIPKNFSRTGEAYVVLDARNSTTAGIAAGYVASIAERFNRENGTAAAVSLIDRQRFNENGITRYAGGFHKFEKVENPRCQPPPIKLYRHDSSLSTDSMLRLSCKRSC